MRNILLAALLAALTFPCHAQGVSLYPWEEGRDVLPKFSQMTLCYGGSGHRQPLLWGQSRFAPMVTCKDVQGREQWLFDSFLAIEFADISNGSSRSYSFGYPHQSANKASWASLINYWFKANSGFDALNRAVGAAIKRIGQPASKRTVVMTLPDPIMYKMYNDSTTTSVYWGELDGRAMDFKVPADRIAAMKWFIDEVRSRWNKAGFENLELLGFYLISEDLAIPGDGWSAELKHYEDIIPPIADYLHSCNEGLYWIPYYAAAPYTKWRKLGIDMAIMQPNMFWGGHDNYTFARFASMITTTGMGMELEFDVKLLGSSEEALMYKDRFRQYLNAAKSYKIYGKKPMALYSDTNAFYALATSTDASDKALFREFCDFLLNDPQRQGGIAGIGGVSSSFQPEVKLQGQCLTVSGAEGGTCAVYTMAGTLVGSKSNLAEQDSLHIAMPKGQPLVAYIKQGVTARTYKLLAK